MIDPFGRTISYLRVSVTDRCDLRCVYCMAEDMTFLPKPQVLSLEELERLCLVFVRLGVRKLRLTGGEPLVRRDVMGLIAALGKKLGDGLDELTLTTNGTQLERYADALAHAGVKRVNVSLDTLSPERFSAITRWGRLEKVLAGIFAAKSAGLKVKINTVALQGVNEDEFDSLIEWCGQQGFDLTLIETMPMGEISMDRTDQYLPLVQDWFSGNDTLRVKHGPWRLALSRTAEDYPDEGQMQYRPCLQTRGYAFFARIDRPCCIRANKALLGRSMIERTFAVLTAGLRQIVARELKAASIIVMETRHASASI